MSDYLAPSLNTFVFDGVTANTDGIMASCSELDGWWDSADMNSSMYDRAHMGQGFSILHRNARGITLSGFLHRAAADDPVGSAGIRALRAMKAEIGSALSSVLLSVPEDLDVPFALTARVNQVGAIRTRHISMGGQLVTIEFQIPLLAQDPRRYNAVESTALDTTDLTVTNLGDLPTPLRINWPGGTTDPFVVNNTLADAPLLAWNGTASSNLYIDTGALVVMDGGSNAIANLTSAQWFMLAPGDNALTISPAADIAWQDAYS
jgi:hypothetical protein